MRTFDNHESPMSRPVNVAILMETSRSFGRGVIRGISKYAHLHGPWVFHITPGDLHQQLPPPHLWQGDGVIGRISQADAKQVLERNLKFVSIGGDAFVDQRHVGTQQIKLCDSAIKHLLERGFQRLAYFESFDPIHDDADTTRGRNFQELVEASGHSSQILQLPWNSSESGRETAQRALADWLSQLTKPVGVVTFDDLAGRKVIDACALADIHVPEEVAVVGIDNDELICDLAYPSLSSVALNAERIGFEAAAIFHGLVAGKPPPQWVEVEPLGVVTRQSTDLMAIEDPDVASAVRFIRENARKGISVDDVLREVPISRRTLEVKFKRILGRTPQVEIRRLQVERAKELLIKSDLKLDQIARESGFSRAEYMHSLFRKMLGMTPADFRGRNRLAPAKASPQRVSTISVE
jgi:LacI family transcriptional regulator